MSKENCELQIVQPNVNAAPRALKYYDPELQNASNSEPYDRARYEHALARGARLHREYIKQLRELRSRLSKRTYSLFADERGPLFDSNLVEFAFGDQLDGRKLGGGGWRPKTSARATFLSFDMKTIHVLRYQRIRSLKVNVPNERWFDMGSHDIDSLLAHELTSPTRDLLQHQFLFVSGTSISLTFEQVVWSSKRVRR